MGGLKRQAKADGAVLLGRRCFLILTVARINGAKRPLRRCWLPVFAATSAIIKVRLELS